MVKKVKLLVCVHRKHGLSIINYQILKCFHLHALTTLPNCKKSWGSLRCRLHPMTFLKDESKIMMMKISFTRCLQIDKAQLSNICWIIANLCAFVKLWILSGFNICNSIKQFCYREVE